MDDLIARLREDRLMNPDYPTRLEAAREIERLREALEEILAAFREYTRTTTAQAIARVKKAEIKADAALKGENDG